MASGRLKNKVVSGVVWSMSEKAGTMLLQMVVSIIVARRLMPEDFGVMAIMTFFTSISLAIVDSGFSQTLIRKQSPTADEYRSVQIFNIAAAVVLYLVLVALSPAIATFYGYPVIADIAPVLMLLLPINAMCVVQNAVFMREFRFAMISKIVFLSSFVSGAVAIAVKAALFALVGRRPGGSFSVKSLRGMAPYSMRLLATDLIAAVYNNIAQLIIGKTYSATALGYFSQAQKLKDLPVTSTVQSVQNVTFPALAELEGDRRKFDESYRQILMITAFVMFPLMAGLIAIAPDMFRLLLGQKWMPTVPYFEIVCLCGLCYPLSVVAYNVLKTRSDGAIILRLEVLKKIVMTAILAYVFLVPHSIEAVAWGVAAMSAVELAVNLVAARRYTTLPLSRIFTTLLPTIATTAVMFAAVAAVGKLAAGHSVGLRLFECIAAGAAVYTLLSLLLRSEAMLETVKIVRRIYRRQ